MYPYVELFGAKVSTFTLMAAVAAAVAAAVLLLSCKISRAGLYEPFLTAATAFFGAVIGAKALKPIIRLPDVIVNWDSYRTVPIGEFLSWYFNETVFYGGLIGGTLFAFLLCVIAKFNFPKTADVVVPAIPVAHALGRVGCFLGGCCYGAEASGSPFAVVYPPRADGYGSVAAPAGVELLPVQLFEAAGNVAIAAVLLTIAAKRKPSPGVITGLYGLMYSVQRFVLEFFRGDLARGVYGGISTSQIISLFVFTGSLTLLLVLWRRSRRQAP